ncbi:Calcium-dependent phosphotriesterase superfamily protein [Quillaja saponaria]|uniref:Calcium-dependent phosphotriesterase superfamily protein n=1 Tax=Quillaja saponaria TaxID=32244 RepID=A0AAD7VIY8_QUISA|nr:Calcium-dependent phosphotriesterase superfamily protein [Quillaja saponaria]
MAFSCLCSTKFLAFLFLISTIPIGIIISLQRAQPTTHVYYYHGAGWFRESCKWDDHNRRFLLSFLEGGVGQISVPEHHMPETILQEVPLVKDADLARNSSLGIVIDRPRNRLLVVYADIIGHRYAALAAYDLSTWKCLFLSQLSGPKGNAYVTDAKASKIWKVGVDGKFLHFIRSPLFTLNKWYKTLVALNGIGYHPDGFLIVIHSFSGNLFKIDVAKEEVKLIKVAGGPLSFGDGLELLSLTKLVVAGNYPTGRLVESSDGWGTASLGKKLSGPTHRLSTAATVKDGKVYLNHLVGMGYPKKKHVIVVADF